MDWHQTASFSCCTPRMSGVATVLESLGNMVKEVRAKFNLFHIYFLAINYKLS